MEFYRIWRILVGNKWILIWLPIVATCVGLAITYVLPEQYESTALVVAQPFEDVKFNTNGGEQRGLPDFPVTLTGTVDTPSKTYMAMIKSPAVAVQIVEALQLYREKLHQPQGVFETIRDEARTWIKTTIRTARNYLRYGRDIQVFPFDLAVENVEKDLAVAATKDTYAFEISYRSSDPAEAAAVANKAAEMFLEQRTKVYRSDAARAREFAQMQRAESRKTLEQARAAVLAYENSGQTFEPKSEYDTKLKNESGLEYTLAEAEGNLAALKFTTGGDSPKVLAKQAEIAELKKQISALKSQLATYPEKQARLNSLIFSEGLAKDNYQFFSKRYEEARVKESADVTEIRIVSRAAPSLYPVKPIKYVYAGLSFATAMVAAIGWVLFFESLDPRVRTRDCDDEFDVVVLGAIPTMNRSQWSRHNLVLIRPERSEPRPDAASASRPPEQFVASNNVQLREDAASGS